MAGGRGEVLLLSKQSLNNEKKKELFLLWPAESLWNVVF